MEKFNDKIISWCPKSTIEDSAQQQLKNLSELPFLFKHVAVMPDCHYGKGATVGSVIATQGAIVPAAVGVDIGCGMIAVRTGLTSQALPDDLENIRHSIERSIPLGAGVANKKLTPSAEVRVLALLDLAQKDYSKFSKWNMALGTLGSGNHFIELCLDEADTLWLVLHSGSRGVGNKIAQTHIKIAQGLCEQFFVALKDKDLAYLPEKTLEFDAYIEDLLWAQHFALLNREEMMDRVLKDLSFWLYGEGGHEGEIEKDRINCHHNFTQKENHMGHSVWVTRKGAIQSRKGQRGVIPGSMGTRSYIVEGLENPIAFHSAPHGAGRRMSRGEAKRTFTLEDFDKQMVGVECRRSEALLDELPGAYKDIDAVMTQAEDLVKITHTLRQIVNVKGD